MKTPQLFSSKPARDLLPEVLGRKYQRAAIALAAKAGHRCEVTGYPYPPIRVQQGDAAATTPLMIEPLDRNEHGQPLSPKVMEARIRQQGLSRKTVRMVCPLVYWSRHVDLAIEFRRGTLVFAPWLSQGELITVFRTLATAAGQADSYGHIPTIGKAMEAMNELELHLGNHGLLTEVMALPEDSEWNPRLWIDTLQKLPARERRLYYDRFARHIRFWPSTTAFQPLFGYWATTAHQVPSEQADSVGNPWISRFSPLLERALANHNGH